MILEVEKPSLNTLVQDHQKVFLNFYLIKFLIAYSNYICIHSDSGLHRYVFLVYKQPGKINPDEKRATKTSREGRRQVKLQ